ncbi:hypothetical protein ABT373_04385 [Streptomyces sp. NPDC000070]|uniref:hypothetical protein n=1 Tax=Streptomyces sp. NPDC000070 TaxID=3154240 RepID=UPI00331A4415
MDAPGTGAAPTAAGRSPAATSAPPRSARCAVNAPLEADNSDAVRCRVRKPHRPSELEPLKRGRRVDDPRYRLGLPGTFDLGQAP